LILENCVLPGRQNNLSQHFGTDSPTSCYNKKWFKNYEYNVEYRTNSRGYRDTEWPNDVNNAIFCIGDSFTYGVGSPVEHTWPYMLEQKTGIRCLNLAINGASNDLIKRKIHEVRNECKPVAIIACWSYLHRREASDIELLKRINQQWIKFYNDVKGTDWPECNNVEQCYTLPEHIQKEVYETHNFPWWNWLSSCPQKYDDLAVSHYDGDFATDDVENFKQCLSTTDAINLIIPNFCSPDDYETCKSLLQKYQIYQVNQIDMARDYLHWDSKTSKVIVDYLTKKLSKYINECKN